MCLSIAMRTALNARSICVQFSNLSKWYKSLSTLVSISWRSWYMIADNKIWSSFASPAIDKAGMSWRRQAEFVVSYKPRNLRGFSTRHAKPGMSLLCNPQTASCCATPVPALKYKIKLKIILNDLIWTYKLVPEISKYSNIGRLETIMSSVLSGSLYEGIIDFDSEISSVLRFFNLQIVRISRSSGHTLNSMSVCNCGRYVRLSSEKSAKRHAVRSRYVSSCRCENDTDDWSATPLSTSRLSFGRSNLKSNGVFSFGSWFLSMSTNFPSSRLRNSCPFSIKCCHDACVILSQYHSDSEMSLCCSRCLIPSSVIELLRSDMNFNGVRFTSLNILMKASFISSEQLW